jgi:hypothetical protein
MLKWLVRRKLAAFEREFQYDTSYWRDILDVDTGAFFKFARVSKMAEHSGGMPAAPWYAAKLVGTLAEDCGPCTQLVVTQAERAGVPADVLRAIVARDEAAMPDDVALAYRFARAALDHAPEADDLRDQATAKWGKRGVVALAFGVTAARMFPTMKYALGHGKTCMRVTVAGAAVPVARIAAG